MRHPDEEIFVRVVVNWDAEVPYTRVWMFGRDGFSTNRNNMGNTTLCQRAGGLCRNETRRKVGGDELGHGTQKKQGANTNFPKKSFPSMMTLTFLNPIFGQYKKREAEETELQCVVNHLLGNWRDSRHLGCILRTSSLRPLVSPEGSRLLESRDDVSNNIEPSVLNWRSMRC
jgi:hypothetical protein